MRNDYEHCGCVERDNVQNHRVAASDVDFTFGPAGNSGAFFCYPTIGASKCIYQEVFAGPTVKICPKPC